MEPFDAEPGAHYETEDGTDDEVRTVEDGEWLCPTWQPADCDEPATLQITLTRPRSDA